MGMVHIWNMFSLISAEKADMVNVVFHGFSMYVYIRGGPIGPCTTTYSGLLCFPFYSSPQKSCTSNEMQDLVCGGVEIVTWIHKILAQVTQSPKS
jgi:hypothetical protein